MDTATAAPVTLTAGAVKELKKLISDDNFSTNLYLRVGVKGGGCSGMSYVLGFDQKQEGDQEFEIDGIRCVITKAHEMYLVGIEIDYQHNLDSRGFTFSNPNASKTCGCGSSFGV